MGLTTGNTNLCYHGLSIVNQPATGRPVGNRHHVAKIPLKWLRILALCPGITIFIFSFEFGYKDMYISFQMMNFDASNEGVEGEVVGGDIANRVARCR